MLTLILTRNRQTGKAVLGKLVIPFSRIPIYEGEPDARVNTIENADFIIPAGTYPLARTWSPKFKKLLPIVEDVPDREGIRIHRGTIPEHSTGCILTDMTGQSMLDVLFNRINNYYEDEKVFIDVRDDFGADSGSGC